MPPPSLSCTSLAVLAGLTLPPCSAIAAPTAATFAQPPPTITRAAVEHYSKFQKMLDADKAKSNAAIAGQPSVINQVNAAWGRDADHFTADQITAALKPLGENTFGYEAQKTRNLNQRGGEVPVDAISAHDAVQLMDEYAFLNHKSAAVLKKALADKYGDWDSSHTGHVGWYIAVELRDVEENGADKKRKEPADWGAVEPATPITHDVAVNVKQIHDRPLTFWEHFKSPLIRQSWRDVLYDEDPSLTDADRSATKASPTKLSDLVGATFSYAHNGRSDSDTWTAIGALIEPWRWKNTSSGNVSSKDDDRLIDFTEVDVAPSVSIDRVDSNDPATKEIDTLAARLGVYTEIALEKFPENAYVQVPSVQVRAAGVYATDTGGHARLPGGEADVEFRWFGALPVGYDHIFLHKQPLLAKQNDRSLLDGQFRFWLHMEGGVVQDNGATWDTSKGEFFRIGPSVQYQLNAPRLAFGKDASLTALYTHLEAIKGDDKHNSFLKINLVFDLVKDETFNHKISLNLTYQRGGLDFTKEDVDSFTAGLGVLF